MSSRAFKARYRHAVTRVLFAVDDSGKRLIRENIEAIRQDPETAGVPLGEVPTEGNWRHVCPREAGGQWVLEYAWKHCDNSIRDGEIILKELREILAL